MKKLLASCFLFTAAANNDDNNVSKTTLEFLINVTATIDQTFTHFSYNLKVFNY